MYHVIIEGTRGYRRVEHVNHMEDLMRLLRQYRWYATDARATVTAITISPTFLNQEPLPGFERERTTALPALLSHGKVLATYEEHTNTIPKGIWYSVFADDSVMLGISSDPGDRNASITLVRSSWEFLKTYIDRGWASRE